MKPKVIHLALFESIPVGVLRQMDAEQRAAQTLGIPWKTVIFSREYSGEDPRNVEIVRPVKSTASHAMRLFRWYNLRKTFCDTVLNMAADRDVVVLRYDMANPLLYGLMKALRRSGKRVFLSHHTLEGHEIHSQARGASYLYVKWAVESLVARPTIRAADGVVGVTQEVIDYQLIRAGADIPVFLGPNGAEPGLSVADRRSDMVPEIMFMASEFPAWHGLDLLISSMACEPHPAIVHVVGDVPADLRVACESVEGLVLHGRLDTQRIRQLAEACWVGLGSLALWRKGMTQACTLKVREYLTMGLPVYAGYMDVFPERFPYFRFGSASIGAICDYAHAIRGVSRDTVHAESSPYIDKVTLLSQLYAFLSSTP